MKLGFVAVLFLFLSNYLDTASGTPQRFERCKEGCQICGRKNAARFLKIDDDERQKKKDIKDTFCLETVPEGYISIICDRLVRRYKSTGKKAASVSTI